MPSKILPRLARAAALVAILFTATAFRGCPRKQQKADEWQAQEPKPVCLIAVDREGNVSERCPR